MPTGVGVQTWEGYVAHPKLATTVRRSLLSATAAALMAGPLAAAGAAQTVDGLLDLTCEEALKTEEAPLIEEFCTAEELEALSPLTKSVDDTAASTTKTVTSTTDGATPKAEEGSPTGGSTPTDTVVPDDEGGSDPGGTNTNVKNTGGEPRGFDDESARSSGSTGSGAGESAARRKAANDRAASAPSGGFGYNADGPFRPGMQSHSSLTLQPFAAPLVSVPPIYELPQVAQQLFGSTSEATAADPQTAGAASTASPYSATGFSATSADPTGWLAATATGLIMLVGAGHALNGGRKPSRPKA